MPRATRKRTSAPDPEPEPIEEVEAEEEEQEDDEMEDAEDAAGGAQEGGAGTLRNDKELNWRAGRPIQTGVLLARLKALAEELHEHEQGEIARHVLAPKATELANTQLLDHKDEGVRTYTLLCIVEMFRLLAPDAPYKQSQLDKIFKIVVNNVVLALGNPGHLYNETNLSIIQSLATVKSIVLLGDLPGADKLLEAVFRNSFDVLAVNAREADKDLLSKNVEYNLTAMLATLVDETDVLPSAVTEIILAQFLRADPSSAKDKKGEQIMSDVLREFSPAYNMARSVCNSCEDRMSRQIGQYFNAVLIDASQVAGTSKPSKPKGKKRTHDESEDEDDSGLLVQPSDADLSDLDKAHRLLRELWRACPSVIQNVVPQIEAETSVENVPLREMAVASIGDMIAGIGAAGPPVLTPLDPAAYPSQSNSDYELPQEQNIALVPAAPQRFSATFPTTYQAFIDRHRDKVAKIRALWTIAAGRIILTSGGGKGLDADEEVKLLRYYGEMFQDTDEKVRLAAVQSAATFDYRSILQKLARAGGLNKEGSVLHNLGQCVRDKQLAVSSAAVDLMGRIWGVASGAMIDGDERTRELLGSIPDRILGAIYANNKTLNFRIQKATAECLLPINFPPIKSKKNAKGDSQRIPDSQEVQDGSTPDADKIRVQRILALVRDLHDKPREAFFQSQHRQISLAGYVLKIQDLSEKIGAKPKSKTAAGEKEQRQKLIAALSSLFPDPKQALEHLTAFFEHYDRRNYTLVGFAVEAKSDYKKVKNAIGELRQRILDSPSNVVPCLDTVLHTLHLASPLVYNRSHVPAIVQISRSDEAGLGQAAHDVLKEISAKAPAIFEHHVKDLCNTLKTRAPKAPAVADSTVADTLKACAGFARQFPQKMPNDREFLQAMSNFAKYGSPPTVVKHAVTVIVTSAEKQEMYVKDILNHCITDFDIDSDGALSKLSAISQLRLLANELTEDQHEAIAGILANALKNRSTANESDPDWSNTVDDELQAKLLALKAVVNNVRGQLSTEHTDDPSEQVRKSAEQVFRVLNTIVESEGELSRKGGPSPAHHRSHLRLAAAKLILKLCCHRQLDRVFLPVDFIRLHKIVQDTVSEVRAGFNVALRKYLGQHKLTRRFFSMLFIYAWEPTKSTKESTIAFLRGRATTFAKAESQTMEGVFADLMSLLAHHPDFSPAQEDLPDFIDYILFYLKIVATEKNLGTIYAFAQRTKQVQDGLDPEKSDYLWTLSDLAQAVIRTYEQLKGWSLQMPPGKLNMPRLLYQPIADRELAQKVSEKLFLPEDFAEDLEERVRKRLRPKKRKAGDDDGRKATKKARASTADDTELAVRKKKEEPRPPKVRKTPKKRDDSEVPPSERRKSSRVSNAKTYAEESDSDIEEVQQWDAEDSSEHDEEEADEEKISSTPPTSDHPPTSAAKTNGTVEKTPRITPKSTPKATPRTKEKTVQPQKKAATAKKQPPVRSGRATRGAKKKEKDEFDLPSDSDVEMGT